MAHKDDYDECFVTEMCIGIVCANGGMCDRGVCVCPPSCPTLDEPVCANDSVTYQNICMMRSAACNVGIELRAMYPGECHDSTHTTHGKPTSEGDRFSALRSRFRNLEL